MILFCLNIFSSKIFVHSFIVRIIVNNDWFLISICRNSLILFLLLRCCLFCLESLCICSLRLKETLLSKNAMSLLLKLHPESLHCPVQVRSLFLQLLDARSLFLNWQHQISD